MSRYQYPPAHSWQANSQIGIAILESPSIAKIAFAIRLQRIVDARDLNRYAGNWNDHVGEGQLEITELQFAAQAHIVLDDIHHARIRSCL